MAAAFCNYAFHPVIGRFLDPKDFGDVQALLALVAQSAIVFGAFSVVAINITTNIDSEGERNAILYELQKIALWVTGGALIVLAIFFNQLQSFFNFTSITLLLALAAMWIISVFTTFRNAYLQGVGDFSNLTIVHFMSAAGRLVIAVLFLIIGLSVGGVITALVLSNLIVLWYLFSCTRKNFPLRVPTSLHVLEKGSMIKELRYGVLVFFATALVTIYYTSDVLIVKRFFSPEEAGLYSGISAIAKILFFVIGPVSVVLVSSIKIRNSFKENGFALAKAMSISLGLGTAGLCTFYIFYDLIIALMLGKTYAPMAHMLPKAGLVMLLAALANIFILYFLALRRFFLITLSSVGIGLVGWVMWNGHSTIDTILNHFILFLSLLIVVLVSVYAKDYFNYRTGA